MSKLNKLIFAAILFGAVNIPTKTQAQHISIPDANFKAILVANKNLNTNGDNEIQISEANSYQEPLVVSSKEIADLTGIEHFIQLKELYCTYNKLTKLDLSKNTALTKLYCTANQLTSLNLSKNIDLKDLVCSENKLTDLNIQNNSKLTSLWCSNNRLQTLITSQNLALTHLSCNNNDLAELDLSKNKELLYLYCNNNPLHLLNIKNEQNTKIADKSFNCTNSPNLINIIVDNSDWSKSNWTKIDSTHTFKNEL